MKKIFALILFCPLFSLAANNSPIVGRILGARTIDNRADVKCLIGIQSAYTTSVNFEKRRMYGVALNERCSDIPHLKEFIDNKNAVTVNRTTANFLRHSNDSDLLDYLQVQYGPESYYLVAKKSAELQIEAPRPLPGRVDAVEMDVKFGNLFGQDPICIFRITVKVGQGKEDKLSIYFPNSECYSGGTSAKARYEGRKILFDYSDIEPFRLGKNTHAQIQALKKAPYDRFVASYDGELELAP